MLTDETKVISVDDHVVEPPEVWLNRLPSKYRDVGPRVVEVDDNGNETLVTLDYLEATRGENLNLNHYWACEDRRDSVSLQGSPRTRNFRTDGTGDDFHARSYRDMIEAAYEIGPRLEAMDEDGVWAATCFPTYQRFAATRLLEVNDKAGLGIEIVRAYNDWMLEEWAGSTPGRFMPMVVVPLWDPSAAADEMRRTKAKGAKCITFPENPAPHGLPSFWTDHWDPVFAASGELNMPMCMHIGTSGGLASTAPEMTQNVSIALCGVNAMTACADLIFSGILSRFPNTKIALSEGGSSWVPYLVERMDYTWERTRIATDRSLPPSELFKQHFWSCFISDQHAIETRHAIGLDKLMWEGDFPHNDSQFPNSRRLLEKALADVPAEEARMIAETNARKLFDFWD